MNIKTSLNREIILLIILVSPVWSSYAQDVDGDNAGAGSSQSLGAGSSKLIQWPTIDAALRDSVEMDVFTDADRQVLADAVEQLDSLHLRASEFLRNSCSRNPAERLPTLQAADEIGDIYALSTDYEEQDHLEFFENVLASLSEQGAAILANHQAILFKVNQNRTTDWQEYARRNPQRVIDSITVACESN